MKIGYVSAAVRQHRGAATLLLGAALAAAPATQAQEYIIDAGNAVTVPGDRDNPWQSGPTLFVGLNGYGELNVMDGGQVSTGFSSVGVQAGAEGVLTVSGADASFTSTSGHVISDLGQATVLFSQGAQINDHSVTIAQTASGSASLLVENTDTAWRVTNNLVMGMRGTASMVVRDNALVRTEKLAYLGRYQGGAGYLGLSGGGRLESGEYISVGQAGYGEVTLLDGGQVQTQQGIVGWDASGEGVVNVAGAASEWAGHQYLMLGYFGQGVATVSDGGVVRIDDGAGMVALANQAGSEGTLNIGAAEGDAAAAAGLLVVTQVNFGAGNGTLVFNHANTDYLFSPYLGGAAGTVKHLAGGTIMAGADASFSGLVQLTGGTMTLAASNVLGTGTLELDGGTLATRGDIALAHDTVQLTDSLLRIEQGSASFGGDLDLGNYQLTIDGDGDALFSGAFSAGTGTLNKIGDGALTLTGNAAAFTGTHTVSGGVFAVNTVLGGEVDVQAGGRLQGAGTVGNTTIGHGATLAAGNSIGELTINGDLTFMPGGIFDVEVNPAGTNSDHVYVTGTATLAGSVLHVGEVGNYSPISTYRILTADGGLIDDFDDVASNFLFLDADLIYGATTVDLELRRNDIAFASFADSHNQTSVAQAIEALGAGNAVYDEIVTQAGTPATVQQSYDQLSGELHASALTALLEESRLLRDTATDRLRGGAGDTTLAEGNGYTGWLRPFGNWGRSDGERGTVDMDRDTQGFLLGIDTALDNGGRAGLLAGYSRTEVSLSSRRGDADIDSLHLGLYGESRRGELAVRGGLFYSYQQLDTERRIAVGALNETLTGERSANTVQGFGELGYRLGDDATSVEGFAQLAQLHLRVNSGSEQGGATALRGEQGNTDVTFTTLGVRPATTLGGVRVHGSLGWRHALGDVTPDTALRFAGGESFDIDAAPLARDTLVMEAGVTLSLAERASLRIGYAGQAGGGVSDHGGQATLAWDF